MAAYSTSGSGAQAWNLSSDGDAQTIALLDGKVYVGGHFLLLDGQRRVRIAAINASTGLWTRGTRGWPLESGC